MFPFCLRLKEKQMQITWYGHACFKIQTKPHRGAEEVIIFTDPFDKSIGLRPPQGNADVITVSHGHYDHSNVSALKGDPFVIDSPGEYSLKNIYFEGVDSLHDQQQGAERGRNTIFVIESEEIRICHLGDLGHLLNESQLEKITPVDVLMLPVGGIYTLDAVLAKKVVSQIEPAIILPMHYKVKGLKIDIAGANSFCSDMGTQTEKMTRLSLRKKDLEEKGNKIILLSIANS